MDEIIINTCILENPLDDMNGRIWHFPDHESFEETMVEDLQYSDLSTMDLVSSDYEMMDVLKDEDVELMSETKV